MSRAVLLCLCLLPVLSPLTVVAKPAGGVAKFTNIRLDDTVQNDQDDKLYKIGVCKEIGLYNGSTVHVTIDYDVVKGEGAEDSDVNVPFHAELRLYKAVCANTIGDQEPEVGCVNDLGYSGYVSMVADNYPSPVTKDFASDDIKKLVVTESTAKYYHEGKPVSDTEAPSVNLTTSAASSATTTSPPSAKNTKRSVEIREGDSGKDPSVSQPDQNSPISPTFRAKEGNGMYIVQVVIISKDPPAKDVALVVNVSLKMHNPHGYLSAVDYPALVFYGVMTAVYAIYAFAWLIMMGCAYKDLVRLQFWVLAVILLGFLEKILFVSEYGSINTGNDFSGLIMLAEFVSAIKRALSRMLLIIVAMGFGTVKPRLGDSLGKVVAVGIVYTILAVLDGIIRARNETFVSRDAASTVTLALLLIFDSFVMYWIFTSIVDTRRTLRLRKNYVKLAMYNHFAYMLIFAVVASLGFIVWALVTLNFPAGNCLSDWKEVWLRECFWHVLFAFILLIVMVIWRPSANRNRFAYSLVNDEDDIEEDEPEQGPNKNFDTLKMRQMTKSESEVPPVLTHAEDDLRWVEENLPTTAMDKALPLILDSDEEVMTTKFEMSKMN